MTKKSDLKPTSVYLILGYFFAFLALGTTITGIWLWVKEKTTDNMEIGLILTVLLFLYVYIHFIDKYEDQFEDEDPKEYDD